RNVALRSDSTRTYSSPITSSLDCSCWTCDQSERCPGCRELVTSGLISHTPIEQSQTYVQPGTDCAGLHPHQAAVQDPPNHFLRPSQSRPEVFHALPDRNPCVVEYPDGSIGTIQPGTG